MKKTGSVKCCVKVMSKSLANKIAAGEVVERPASVVKELLENSIDAIAPRSGAMKISIKAGGVGEISVWDNGSGMSKEDVQLVPIRFATSKLRNEKQLSAIGSLGFRGEALSSISAVSKVSIASAKKDGKGYFLEVEGGDVVREGDIVMDKGTVVKVRDLFFNIPARRKFLKGKLAETRACWDIIRRYAVAYPEVGFEVVIDGKVVLKVKPAENGKGIGLATEKNTDERLEKTKERIGKVIKEPWVDTAVVVSDKGVAVDGFGAGVGAAVDGLVMRVQDVGKGRPTQWFFVNRRPVEDQRIKFVVKEAYESVAQKGFPGFVLFVTVPFDAVDVNTHPRKTEVKFKDQAGVYRVVYTAVKKLFDTEKNSWGILRSASVPYGAVRQQKPRSDKESVELAMQFSETLISDKRTSEKLLKRDSIKEKEEWDISLQTPVIQVKNAYLVTADAEGIVVIDQHAAAERILYEEVLGVLSSKTGKGISKQALLVPIDVEADFVGLSKNWYKNFYRIGIDAEEYGKGTIRIRSLPFGVSQSSGKQLFIDLLDKNIADEKSAFEERKEEVAATIACHSAIKFGDKLSPADIRKLLSRLSKCENPFSCPHGRPTMYRIPFGKLESLFGRG